MSFTETKVEIDAHDNIA